MRQKQCEIQKLPDVNKNISVPFKPAIFPTKFQPAPFSVEFGQQNK
jgi:hypothetical protein